jgi:hypothetical protein
MGTPHGPSRSSVAHGLGVACAFERVGIGPLLVHAAPRVLPVIEDVTADLVATMPHIGVALRLQMVLADHHVVEVLNLEGLVFEAVLFALNAEEDAVVDKVSPGSAAARRLPQSLGLHSRVLPISRHCRDHRFCAHQ